MGASRLAEPPALRGSPRPERSHHPAEPSTSLGPLPLALEGRGGQRAEVSGGEGLDSCEDVVEAEDAGAHEGGLLDVLVLQDLKSTEYVSYDVQM